MKLPSPLAAAITGVISLGIFLPAFAADDAQALKICKSEAIQDHMPGRQQSAAQRLYRQPR